MSHGWPKALKHAASKLGCLALSSARSCLSSIYPGRLFTAWLVSLVVFSCHMVSNFPTGDTQGPSVVFEAVDVICSGPLKFSYKYDYFCPLPDRDVGPSAHECDVDISFHFDLACISSYRCETDNNCNTCLLKCRRTLNWMLLRLVHKQSYKLSYSHYTHYKEIGGESRRHDASSSRKGYGRPVVRR